MKITSTLCQGFVALDETLTVKTNRSQRAFFSDFNFFQRNVEITWTVWSTVTLQEPIM
jgi:hypothetical protein